MMHCIIISYFFLYCISTTCGILAQPNNTPQSITIKNTITPEMVAYQHFTGQYSPDPFNIEINGEKLKEGEEKKLALENNEIEVTYHYSFAQGLYKGKRCCKVHIPEKATHASLAFSWNKQPRIFLQQ